MERLAGVRKVKVSFAKKRCAVTYQGKRVTKEAIRKRIEALGYKAKVVAPAGRKRAAGGVADPRGPNR